MTLSPLKVFLTSSLVVSGAGVVAFGTMGSSFAKDKDLSAKFSRNIKSPENSPNQTVDIQTSSSSQSTESVSMGTVISMTEEDINLLSGGCSIYVV